MHQESIDAISEDDYVIDNLIDSESDNRFGITLLIRLSEPNQIKIQQVLSELKAIEPDQYYYPNSDLHVTVLSIISCYQGFDLSDIDIDEYIGLLTKELEDIRKFTIEIQGIALSKSGVLITGYPDTTLNELRDKLRSAFKQSDLQHSIDSRYTIKTAHSTVMRFRKEIQNKEKLISEVDKNNLIHFGTLEVNSLELVFNDWYQRKSRTKMLKVIKLKAD